MRYHRLDLNLLVALDALLEESSVSRAADRVFISQPAMSNALARLRAHFNDQLITQVGRRMVLTERAQALRPGVRDVLLRILELTRPVDDFDPTRDRRHFKLAASDYFAVCVLPRLLRYLEQHAPAIELDVLPLSPKLSEELDRGELDILIVPTIYAFEEHRQQSLFEDDWVCVAWQGNRHLGKTLSLKKYLALEHVVKRENHPDFPPMDELLTSRLGLVRKVAVRVSQYSLLPVSVVGTERIATVQRGLAEQYRQWYHLSVYRCPFEAEPLHELMQWHRVNDVDSGHAWLRAAIAGLFSGHAGSGRPEQKAKALPAPPDVGD